MLFANSCLFQILEFQFNNNSNLYPHVVVMRSHHFCYSKAIPQINIVCYYKNNRNQKVFRIQNFNALATIIVYNFNLIFFNLINESQLLKKLYNLFFEKQTVAVTN